MDSLNALKGLFMTLDELHDRMTEIAEEALEGAQSFSATQLGLDQRASWMPMQVTADCVAVHASQDGGLQYYGGFEYIDKHNRLECGDWILYFAEDCERVQECIDMALDVNDADAGTDELDPGDRADAFRND